MRMLTTVAQRRKLAGFSALLLGLLLSCSLPAQTPLAGATQSLLLDITRAGERIISVGDRGHILHSSDEGQSWQLAATPTRQMLTAVHFADASHGWAVGHDAVILHSRDGGLSWEQQYQDLELEAPLLDVWFADTRTGFATGAYGTFLKTADGGQSWEDVSWLLDNEDGYHLNAIAEIRGGGLFIVGEMGVMFRSADRGESWETVTSPYEGSLFGVQSLAADNSLLAFGLRGNLFVSADLGDSWQEAAVAGPESGLAAASLLDDGTPIIVGHAGSILRGAADGTHYSLYSRPDRLSLAGVLATRTGNLILVGQQGIHHAAATGAPLQLQQ